MNGFGDDGAAALSAALKENHTLTTLDVGSEYEIRVVIEWERVVYWRLYCRFSLHVVFVDVL